MAVRAFAAGRGTVLPLAEFVRQSLFFAGGGSFGGVGDGWAAKRAMVGVPFLWQRTWDFLFTFWHNKYLKPLN